MSEMELNKQESAGSGDINDILKTCLGGYTRQSVMDYLSAIRGQQKKMKAGYLAEISRLQTEKTSLQTSLEAARGAGQTAETEAGRRYAIQEEQLKATYEEQLTLLEGQLALKQQELDLLQKELAKTKEAAKQTPAKPRWQEAAAAARQQEAAGAPSRQELAAESAGLRQELQLKELQLQNEAKRVETLTRQKDSQLELMQQQRLEVDRLAAWNSWLSEENSALSEKLKTQTEQCLSLTRECSRLKEDGCLLQKKLEIAEKLTK